jgi:hypothetical protein
MAISTYSDLEAAVTNWSSRSDLTSRIPEGIALAEAKINRRLRTLDMVTKNASFSITGEYVATPTNFGGVKTFYLNTDPKIALEYMADEEMTALFSSGTDQPRHYNVQGANFRFGPVPDATYSSTLVYWLKVPALSDSATTNWLLTSHPDCYLYLTNAEMSAFANDLQTAQSWEQMGYQILQEIADQSARDQWGGTSMAVRIA